MIEENGKSDNTNKYRFAMLLCIIFAVVHLKKELEYKAIITVVCIGIPIALLIFATTVKLDLARKNYVKGIGGIVVVVSMLMWKRIHAFSVTLEALLMLILVVSGLLLSFKYSGAELEGKFD